MRPAATGPRPSPFLFFHSSFLSCALVSGLPLLGFLLAAPPAARAQGQDPIRIQCDLHCDPISNPLPLAQKRATYQLWVSNLDWVLDQTDPLGVPVSFLSGGQFMEFVADEGSGGPGALLLQRIYASGQQIAAHSHAEYRNAPFDWPSFPQGATLQQSQQSWADDLQWVDQAILTAFAGSPPEPLALIHGVKGAHLPTSEPDYHTLMQTFGIPVRQPGPEEGFYALFGHHVWNPYRPSPANALAEDLTASFVQVTAGPVIGKAGTHGPTWQDMRAPAVKRQFLQLYVNWRHRDRLGLPRKTWCWGWAGHASDFGPGSPSRTDLQDVLAWLDAHFAGRVEPTGSTAMVWDTHRGTGAAYRAWEAAHPGVSSFSYAPAGISWAAYPYLRAVAEEMDGFDWKADLALGPGVEAYLLSKGPLDAVLLWRASGTSVEDLSALVGPAARIVGLETGLWAGTDPSAVTIGQEPLLVTEDVLRTRVIGPPKLGGVVSIELQGPPAVPADLFWALAPGAVSFPHIGVLLLAPPFGLLAAGTTDGAGVFAVPLPIPNLPALTGVTLFFQGAAIVFQGASVKLSIDAPAMTIVP